MKGPRPFLTILIVSLLIVSVLSVGLTFPSQISEAGEVSSEKTVDTRLREDDTSPKVNSDPSVNLTRPDGGERFVVGSTETIWWNMNDSEDVNENLTVDIFYSNNSGSDWNLIAGNITGQANPNRYNWTVPDDTSGNCLVRVNVSDTHGGTSSDISSNNFTITNIILLSIRVQEVTSLFRVKGPTYIKPIRASI